MPTTRAALLLVPLLGAILLAGCTDNLPTGNIEDPGDGVSTQCPTYPDGATVECDAAAFDGALTAARAPAVTDGWLCRSEYLRPHRLSQIFMDANGAMGVYFDWRPQIESITLPEGGVAVTSVTAYTTAGAQSATARYDLADARGFLALPTPLGTTEAMVYHDVRVFYLMEQRGDDWVVIEDAELLVGEHDGKAWFTWRFTPAPGAAPIYVDAMEALADPENRGPTHRPYMNKDITIGDRVINVSTWGVSVRFSDQSVTRPQSPCSGTVPVGTPLLDA